MSSLSDRSVELRDRGHWLAVHLDDNLALFETGSRGSRFGINIGDDDALGTFRGLKLLLEVRRQGLDGQALQSSLLATAGQVALLVALILGFKVELAQCHGQIESLTATVDLQVHGGIWGKTSHLQPE